MSSGLDFQAWPKIGRLNKCMMTITEKLDGTNAQVNIQHSVNGLSDSAERLTFITPCSRNRILSKITLVDGKYHSVDLNGSDNFGFSAWCIEEAEELQKLGEGRHYGEWWGQGIGRGYDVDGRYFSLFNARRWQPAYYALKAGHAAEFPNSVLLVPTLDVSPFDHDRIQMELAFLQEHGSKAAPGYMNPEGIVVEAFGTLFKLTYEHKDGKWQTQTKDAA